LKGNNGLYNFPRGINQMSKTNFCIHEFMNASDVAYHWNMSMKHLYGV
jgi:hypothetical protein